MNEQVYLLLALLSIAWCFLSVVLFFKIWGMTNDVQEIKELLKRHLMVNADTSPKEVVGCDAPEEKPQTTDETAEGNSSYSWGLVPIFLTCIILVAVILTVIFLNAN